MCNTKNTETIRQQLWCDVYTSYLKEMSHLESVKGASRAVEEFDKAFQVDVEKLDSYIKAKEIKEKELAENVQAFFKYQNIRSNDFYPFIHIGNASELSSVYGNNKYWDVTNLTDKKEGVITYGGIGVNDFEGMETIAFLKND